MLTLLFLSKVSDFLKSSRFVMSCLSVFAMTSMVIAREVVPFKSKIEHAAIVSVVQNKNNQKFNDRKQLKTRRHPYRNVGPAITDPLALIPDQVVITDEIAPVQ